MLLIRNHTMQPNLGTRISLKIRILTFPKKCVNGSLVTKIDQVLQQQEHADVTCVIKIWVVTNYIAVKSR